MTKTRYKFLREGLKSNSGELTWKLNEWQHEDNINICNKGLHCSKEIGEAFSFVQGEILALVEVKGKHQSEEDKEVWSDMRIIKAWKWQKKDSVAISIFAAELCLENFDKVFPQDKRPREAIDAAKVWLENMTEENRLRADAAESAAESAARSARSAAESAARSAAESAARSARSAAESAAWSAWSAAWSAAWSVWSAAWSAAESAAWSARSAAYKKIYARFDEQLTKLEIYDGK